MKLALLTALLVVVVAPVARADRRPTYSERAEIFYALPKLDQARGSGCYRTRVSTVDKRWAVVWLARRRGESVKHFTRRCNPGNGVSVMRKRNGRWHHAFDTEAGQKCHGRVPNRVGEDLHADGVTLCGPNGVDY